jgi:ATP-binding cassette subfamily B protein
MGAHIAGSHGGHHHSDESLQQKLWKLIAQEKQDVWIVTIYAIISSILSLIIPLSSEAIVNAVQLGVVTAQLIVLCVVVALGMTVLGLFTVLESYIIDILQRRLFARAAFEVASRLPKMSAEGLFGEYPPEMVNRFFDVMTIQKTLSKLLLDGVNATLMLIAGLLLLAVYHPIFLLFDIVLVLFASIVVFLLSKGGLESSIKESKKKYALVQWLEDVARCHVSFKLYGRDGYVLDRVDSITTEYILARKKHFRVLARQLIGSTVFRAFATVGILGLGGFLVIQQDLSVGQLVAAEIVIISLLASMEKLIDQFDEFYDLLTAIDKMAHITDKPLEHESGEEKLLTQHLSGGIAVKADNLHFRYPNGNEVLKGLNFRVEAGSRTSIVGVIGSGKTTLANLLVRLYEPTEGKILLGEQYIRHVQLESLRSNVSVIGGNIEIFTGTVRDNVLLGRTISQEDVEWSLRIAQIYDTLMALPDGLNTQLEGAGSEELPETVLRCMTIARAIVGKPRLLVIDDVLSGLSERLKIALLEALYACECWTILDISHDADQIRRSQYVLTMEEGNIIEQGTFAELAAQPESRFVHLFPALAAVKPA